MRVTREDAEKIRAAFKGSLPVWTLATSYLAALDVVEALVEQKAAREARAWQDLDKVSIQIATERCFQADAALDAALEKWREG